MKKIVLLLILITSYAFSQNINTYEYVIVPLKFTDFKEPNKFNLNTNTKFLLLKYGFKAYLTSDSIPDEIANSNCRKLYANIVKDNSILTTKIKVVLKDCKDNIVFETAFGKSNEKELIRAYNEALREAGKSFDKLNYRYNGKNPTITEAAEIKSKSDQLENNSQNTITLAPSTDNATPFFFAQPILNGFQVVNSEPKVIMKMFNTSVKNVFIASKDSKTGVVISVNGKWFFEYYENSKLISEPLNLKF